MVEVTSIRSQSAWHFVGRSALAVYTAIARRTAFFQLARLRLRKLACPSHASTKKRHPKWVPFLCGRGDKIRTCDFYVPNVALYQAEPHLVMNLFEALRALPVAVPEICCLLFASPNFDRGHSLVLPFSATGSGRTRPQAEPHLAMHTAAKRMPQIAPMHYSKKTRSCQ